MGNIKPRIIDSILIPTILEIPHDNKILRCVPPFEEYWFQHHEMEDGSPSSPDIVARQILEKKVWLYNESKGFYQSNLRLPKPEELISIIHASFFNEGLGYIKNQDSFRFYDSHIITPEGVYMCANPGGSWRAKEAETPIPRSCPILSTDKLKRILSNPLTNNINGVLISQDKKVAFAPMSSFTFGQQEIDSLSDNGLVIALSRGYDGAKKLMEIAKKRLSGSKVKAQILDISKQRLERRIKYYKEGHEREDPTQLRLEDMTLELREPRDYGPTPHPPKFDLNYEGHAYGLELGIIDE
jgi:hypothetical protein